MSDKIGLKACPFCGNPARMESNHDWHRIIVDHDEQCIFLEPEVVMVPATDDQMKVAVADWNRRAALAKQPAPAVPEGWALVPIKPSIEMVEAGYETSLGQPDRSGHARTIEAYDAMLAAAPAVPVAQEPVAIEVMQFQLKHPDSGETHTVELTRGEVADGMEDTLYEKLSPMVCQCNGDADHECGDYIHDFDLVADPPAAEQPAGTTSDKYRGELYDEVWERARSMGYGNVTMALAYLGRVKAAAQHDTQAVRDVIAERRRQVDAEGWTPEHDDEHGNGEMAAAAGFYALHANDDPRMKMYSSPMRWPWDPKWWKPGPARRMLVKAGALILAEIERLDRALLGKDGEA